MIGVPVVVVVVNVVVVVAGGVVKGLVNRHGEE